MTQLTIVLPDRPERRYAVHVPVSWVLTAGSRLRAPRQCERRFRIVLQRLRARHLLLASISVLAVVCQLQGPLNPAYSRLLRGRPWKLADECGRPPGVGSEFAIRLCSNGVAVVARE